MKNPIATIRRKIESKGLHILRLSIAVVYLWFGILKFIDGNAAETIASETISILTFGLLDGKVSLIFLGILECLIGLSLLFKAKMKVTIPLLYFQMAGTILPLFIFPDKTWISFGMPTLEGQYIIKNIVFISSAILLGAVAHGSKLIVHPEIAEEAKQKENEISDK